MSFRPEVHPLGSTCTTLGCSSRGNGWPPKTVPQIAMSLMSSWGVSCGSDSNTVKSASMPARMLTNSKTPQPQNWFSLPGPFKSLSLFGHSFAKGGRLRSELYVDSQSDTAAAAALFSALVAHRPEIEAVYGADAFGFVCNEFCERFVSNSGFEFLIGFGLKSPRACALWFVEVYSSLLFESSRSPLLSLKKALPPLFWVVLFDATPDACSHQTKPALPLSLDVL